MNQKCYELKIIIHGGEGGGTSYSGLKILCVHLYAHTPEWKLRVISSTSNDEPFPKTPMMVTKSSLIEKGKRNL